jgi:hypothetical protein
LTILGPPLRRPRRGGQTITEEFEMHRPLIVLCALVVAACDTPPPRGGGDPHKGLFPAHVGDDDTPLCRGAAGGGVNREGCTILVNVVPRPGTPPCTVGVQSDQDTVAFAPNVRGKWIVWQLDAKPSGYRFPANGIQFKMDPDNNFTGCRPFANGQLFHCRNENVGSGVREYPYAIRIVDRNGAPACHVDPKIVNQ